MIRVFRLLQWLGFVCFFGSMLVGIGDLTLIDLRVIPPPTAAALHVKPAFDHGVPSLCQYDTTICQPIGWARYVSDGVGYSLIWLGGLVLMCAAPALRKLWQGTPLDERVVWRLLMRATGLGSAVSFLTAVLWFIMLGAPFDQQQGHPDIWVDGTTLSSYAPWQLLALGGAFAAFLGLLLLCALCLKFSGVPDPT